MGVGYKLPLTYNVIKTTLKSTNHEAGKKQFNKSWRISTTPNTTKFFILFKLIQQFNMVILSCLAKKNLNLNLRKKSSVYYWKLHFQARNPHKPPFSIINWTFFLKFKFWFFFARQLRMTILDCCISLKMIKKNLVV